MIDPLALALRELRRSPDTEAAGWADAEDADTLRRILRAAGWALVPVEPTEAMFMRGGDTRVSNRGKDHLDHRPGRRIGDLAARDCYRAMLTAATQQLAQPAGSDHA